VHSLLDTCRVLVGQPVLRGPRVAVITNSRSPGTLASTALTAAGLEPVRANEHLGWRMTADDYATAMAQALGDPDIDGLLVIYAPPVVRDLGAPSAAIDEAARASTKPVVAVTIGAHDGPIVPGWSTRTTRNG
jgi:acyl-CoA synthetase (NDP forming)